MQGGNQVAASDLVRLDPDHPGFRDPAYRARRNSIARVAMEYREGDPVPAVEYTEDEQGVWRTVWEHLAPLHQRYACREYRECSALIALDRERIPQLADVNRALALTTGFAMKPVAGLVSDRTFLGHLGRGVFLATQYIRHASRPLYTPEPDVVHELVGHAATFCHPRFARLNRLFGRAAAEAEHTDDDERLARISRLYWYTLEFGVCREGEALKVCGAGLLSSFGELGRFETQAELRAFDPDAIASTPYDPTDYQKLLFVADSFEELCGRTAAYLVR
jgi:phenylalanine-4-hydroxylase